jgi:ribose transport system substrate-binding protein
VKRLIAAFVSMLLFVGVMGCGQAGKGSNAEKRLQIAVIPKGTTHSFWKSIHAGGVKAAQELGVDIIWQGPQKEDDRQMQIQVVQNFISRGVDGIVLAPLDDRALANPVASAVKRGIPVVVIDSGLQSDAHSSFVATDNRAGGDLCAKQLCELLGGKGKVIMLRYAEGSASTANREQGFLDGMAKYGPNVELLSTSQYAGATMEKAFQSAQNLLNRFAEVDGIFCPNESSTQGMLRALQTSRRAGKVKFVGFDSNETLVQALRSGEVHGLALQSPFNMGYLGVVTAAKVIRGEPVDARVDTGVTLLTPENIDDPEMVDLINPPLAKYLGE